MSCRGAGRAGSVTLIALALLPPAPGAFGSQPAAAPSRQVVVIVHGGLSYEDALDDRSWRTLAETGGIGLMTAAGGPHGEVASALTVGAGRPMGGEVEGPIAFAEAGDGLLVDAERYGPVSGDAEPGLLGSILAEAGHTVGYVDLRTASADPAMLVAMDLRGRIPVASLNAFPTLAELPPGFLAADAASVLERASVVISPSFDVLPLLAERSPEREVLVVAVALAPTEEMRERADLVMPIVKSDGATEAATGDPASAGGLTSRTTSRAGIVSIIDVAPTVLGFLGVRTPPDLAGSPIRVSEGPPTDLHRRYLEWRVVAGPLAAGATILTVLTLALGLILVVRGRRRRPAALGVAAAISFVSVSAFVVFVPASLLPTFRWPVVLGAVVAGAAALAGAAILARPQRPIGQITPVAMAGLALVVVDVSAGWVSGSTPLLGGSALDGERFFGLGNTYAGIVLSGAVLAAAVMRPATGTSLIAAAAVFAGLPFLGADVGGCMTLAIAAALWFGLHRWDSLRAPTLLLAAGAAAAALAFLLVTHRLLPPGATHVSRIATEAGGPLGWLEVFWDRLRLNLEVTAQTPAAWLAVLGLPVWLGVALRAPARLRPPLEPGSASQRALVTLSLAGVAGYVLNDTFGMATITFLFVSAAVIYPALLAVRRTSPATAPTGG